MEKITLQSENPLYQKLYSELLRFYHIQKIKFISLPGLPHDQLEPIITRVILTEKILDTASHGRDSLIPIPLPGSEKYFTHILRDLPNCTVTDADIKIYFEKIRTISRVYFELSEQLCGVLMPHNTIIININKQDAIRYQIQYPPYASGKGDLTQREIIFTVTNATRERLYRMYLNREPARSRVPPMYGTNGTSNAP